MNTIEKKIYSVCLQTVQSSGFMLIDVAFRGDSKNKIIEVYIDSASVVTIDDCSSISRNIIEILETDNEINFSFRLDVSSPGVDRPLKFIEQFSKHTGRQFEIDCTDETEKEMKFKGKLIRLEGENLFFSKGKEELKINFNNIKKAKVLVSFDNGGKKK